MPALGPGGATRSGSWPEIAAPPPVAEKLPPANSSGGCSTQMPIRRYGNDVTAVPSMLKVHDPSAVPPMVPFQMKHSSSASWREEKVIRNASPV